MQINFIHTKNLNIFHQLQLEEALLRIGKGNWCIINEGSTKAIVFGISAQIENEIDTSIKIDIIKRFSGGGNVVVDENTIFITFIFDKTTFSFPTFPEQILNWTKGFYKKVFPSSFCLKENDFVIGNKKCGGNAQYIQKDRYLHHTSFLWDFSSNLMDYLAIPKKQPKYRNNRPHTQFLYRLKDMFENKSEFINSCYTQLQNIFSINHISYEEAKKIILLPHRKATKYFCERL